MWHEVAEPQGGAIAQSADVGDRGRDRDELGDVRVVRGPGGAAEEVLGLQYAQSIGAATGIHAVALHRAEARRVVVERASVGHDGAASHGCPVADEKLVVVAGPGGARWRQHDRGPEEDGRESPALADGPDGRNRSGGRCMDTTIHRVAPVQTAVSIAVRWLVRPLRRLASGDCGLRRRALRAPGCRRPASKRRGPLRPPAPCRPGPAGRSHCREA